MEIKHEDGTFKTLEELRDEAVALVVDELECYGDDLEFPNYIREQKGLPEINYLEEDAVNEALRDVDPWDILNILNFDSGNGWDDFFTYDGYDFETCSDMWEDVDLDEVATEIVEDYYPKYFPRCITDILDDYETARTELLRYNKYRKMADEVITRYKNCEATEFDLIYILEKLVRTDDAWTDEEE